MARTRSKPIEEPLRVIRKLEQQLSGTTMRSRIAMLRMLKEDPSLRLIDVAQRLGVSHQAVKRWWRWYSEEGIERLCGRKMREETLVIKGLRNALNGEKLRSLQQVRRWVAPPRSLETAGDAPLFSKTAMEFLQSLPLSYDVSEWMKQFRTALLKLCTDVDHISLTINLQCDLLASKGKLALSMIQHVDAVKIPVATEDAVLSPEKRLLANYRRQGFAFHKYQEPITITYNNNGAVYLAVIVLWRELHSPPISQRTLDTFEQLQSFFILLFSDALARANYARPLMLSYMNAVDAITREYGLTRQERRVLTLYASGATRETIATSMGIALNTVRTHLRNIYRKTEAHSLHDLLTLHLVPGS